jgi:hypothetical protein
MAGPRPNRPRASLADNVLAVLWAFLGVRRKSDFQQDIVKLNPIHLMITGVVLAFLFVGVLMALVFWIAG